MNKNEVIKETLTRLFVARSCKPLGGNKTREEEWLESILRILMDIPDDREILVDIDTLKSFDN
jgi:hypothetical protein